MFKQSLVFFRALIVTQRAPSPLEIFNQVQQGISPPLASQRAFLNEHFTNELTSRGITRSKLAAMDHRTCNRLLREMVFQRFLAVPFRLFTFDMEFTDAPRFTAEGPTADITEIGVYSPARDARLSVLVKTPGGKAMPQSTVDLTGITPEMIERDGVLFADAWKQVEAFINTPESEDELPQSHDRILLLSHGGKLADVSMLQWALKTNKIDLPSSFAFGDTFNIIRDAHRRRPVTPDKHPPSWRLGDLVGWLKVETSESAHRAGDDAKLTWDALFHTLDRYGDESLSPRQQLVMRFYDGVAKEQMRMHRLGGGGSGSISDLLPPMDDTSIQEVASFDMESISLSGSGSGGNTSNRLFEEGQHAENASHHHQHHGKSSATRGGAKAAKKTGGAKALKKSSSSSFRRSPSPSSSTTAMPFVAAGPVVDDVPDL